MEEPIDEIRNFLRIRLVDPNPARDIPNYVYTWWPRFQGQDLTSDSFPIVTVSQLAETATVMGLNSTVHWETFQIQIDTWAKEDRVFDMPAGTPREGKAVAFKIAREVQEALRLYWISDFAMNYKFKLYKMTGKKPVSYDFEKKLWKVSMTIEVEVDIGSTINIT